MSNWNFADLFERMAARFPDHTAVIDGDRSLDWAEFEDRAEALAGDLLGRGIGHQGKVAVYSRNRFEFLEAYFGILKARLVPVNVNWRYQAEELVYVLKNADVEAVVVEDEFSDLVEQIAPLLPGVTCWYVLASAPDRDPVLPAMVHAVPYEQVVGGGRQLSTPPTTRSGEDLVLIYTGGTTGMPKGVVWRQADMFDALLGASRAAFGLPVTDSMDELVAGISGRGPRGLSASPFMHATGLLHQFIMLSAGGSTVMLPGRRFDSATLWRTVADNKVTAVVIVGDAFAVPMLDELEQNGDSYDLGALEVISSSGAIWGRSVKEGLLRHLPWVRIFDSLASSEGFGLAGTTLTADTVSEPPTLALGPNVRVRSSDGSWMDEGAAGVGMVAVGGPLPVGYYKDLEKTAETFRTIDGNRYSLPGDYVEVRSDGTVHFLGRGSACINTAGEKVYAEEVELVVKEHPAVSDAACLGMPHPRFGAEVWVVVSEVEGRTVTGAEVVAHVKERLAAYKAPRRVIVVESVPRTAQGKVDHPRVRALAEAFESSDQVG